MNHSLSLRKALEVQGLVRLSHTFKITSMQKQMGLQPLQDNIYRSVDLDFILEALLKFYYVDITTIS